MYTYVHACVVVMAAACLLNEGRKPLCKSMGIMFWKTLNLEVTVLCPHEQRLKSLPLESLRPLISY